MIAGKDMTPAVIDEVVKDSPAFVAGMKKNDIIISIDNKKVESILEVSTFINISTSETIKFIILRNDQEVSLLVKPNLVDGKDSLGNSVKKRMIGIKLSPLNNEFKKQPLGPSKAIYYSVKEVWFVTVTSLNYLAKMITGSADSSQLGGPIRIAKITGQIAEYGLIPFFSIMAYISISLGLINLFPIPMLDGGHLMFYLIEKILGRPLSQKIQEGFFRIGLFLLVSLMFFVTFNDLKDLGLF
jgi:regulator of sigma E protease